MFGPSVVGLSLGSACRFRFRREYAGGMESFTTTLDLTVERLEGESVRGKHRLMIESASDDSVGKATLRCFYSRSGEF